jgi:hypothetical protein
VHLIDACIGSGDVGDDVVGKQGSHLREITIGEGRDHLSEYPAASCRRRTSHVRSVAAPSGAYRHQSGWNAPGSGGRRLQGR